MPVLFSSSSTPIITSSSSTPTLSAVNHHVGARTAVLVTQVVTRPADTFTTVVTLGSNSQPAQSGSAPPPPPPSSAHDGLSQDAFGGIIGGVVAFVAILLVFLICCGRLRAPRSRHGSSSGGSLSSSYYSGSGSGSGSSGRRRNRHRPRGGGGGNRKRPKSGGGRRGPAHHRNRLIRIRMMGVGAICRTTVWPMVVAAVVEVVGHLLR
ncbi:hypothetical protein PG995_002838 [Apiospora arundinis]